MVPKIIHCFWAGGPKTKLAKKCRASWEKYAADWRIVEWDVEKILATENTKGAEFLLGAIAAKKWAMVSDWTRMKALYEEGGVYLDYDVELIRPFEPPEGEWVASEWTVKGETWMNPGSGIALEKGSKIARHMLEEYEELKFDPKRDMMKWIVDRLKVGLRVNGEEIKVLEPEVMSPIDTKGKLHLTEKTLGIHHYAMSGSSLVRRIVRWLAWHGMWRTK